MRHRPQIYHNSDYRADWSTRSYSLHGPIRIIALVIIHYSATPQSMSPSFEDCRHDHIFHRNFRDIDYHFYLIRDGKIHHERPLDKIDAHCQGHNKHSIGICHGGGLDSNHKPSDTRTLPQKTSLVAPLRGLKQMFPNMSVVGHHDLSPIEECPYFNAVTGYRGL